MDTTIAAKQNYLALAINEIEDYAIILLDIDGNILNWNKGAQNIKGYLSEEIIGRNFRKFYTETDLFDDKPGKLIKTAKESGRAHDEGWRVRKDGSLFWGSITITAVHDISGNLIGFSKVTRDLTERKKADMEREIHEQQLLDKNKELEQFLYIASHDLQEPLRTVTNFTGLLGTKYEHLFDSEGKKMFEYMNQGCLRMMDLIKGLLYYSKIGLDKKITLIDSNNILQLAKNDLALIIAEKNAEIISDILPEINGYETEIRLLFQNLLSNAIKFSKPGIAPVIKISAESVGRFWKFSVSDNGIGIDPKFSERIFQIFQRLHLKNEYEGSGIGLSHCSKIVTLHGGKIWVNSEPALGSTFCFTISKFLI